MGVQVLSMTAGTCKARAQVRQCLPDDTPEDAPDDEEALVHRTRVPIDEKQRAAFGDTGMFGAADADQAEAPLSAPLNCLRPHRFRERPGEAQTSSTC